MKEVRFCNHWIGVVLDIDTNHYNVSVRDDLGRVRLITDRTTFSSLPNAIEFLEYLQDIDTKKIQVTPKEFTAKVYHELSNGAIPELSAAILTYLIELYETTLSNIIIPVYQVGKNLWKMHNNKPQIYTVENIVIDMSLNSNKKLYGTIKYRLRIGESAGVREEVYEDTLKREFFESKSELIKSFLADE